MAERHELDAFVTLAEELHFGRTAEKLHVSTARVSQTIRGLERRVGLPLFNRTSRRVELTTIGRQLYTDVRPAWTQIDAAFGRAIEAGRGLSGTLRVAFTDAAGAQLLLGATDLFRERQPDCEVSLREAQLGDTLPWLRSGEVDLVIDGFPVRERDIVMGPVLVREARVLAVPVDHPFAHADTVGVEDLARVTVLQLPESAAESVRADRSPGQTPAGRPVDLGRSTGTLQELLTLVAAGEGVLPVGAHTGRYYARPDVAYVPFADAPAMEWGLLWRTDGASARVRAFAAAADDLLRAGP